MKQQFKNLNEVCLFRNYFHCELGWNADVFLQIPLNANPFGIRFRFRANTSPA